MIYTKYILFSLLLVCPSVLSAQGITRRIHQIDEVTVWGKRPMKEIGGGTLPAEIWADIMK